jgi:hypothetical protein
LPAPDDHVAVGRVHAPHLLAAGSHEREEDLHAVHAVPVEVRVVRLDLAGRVRVAAEDIPHGGVPLEGGDPGEEAQA